MLSLGSGLAIWSFRCIDHVTGSKIFPYIETKSPVRQLKGWVDCRIWVRILRDGIHWWTQIIDSSSGIIPRERCHKVCCSCQYLIPPFKCRFIWEGSVFDLGKVHRMRLLPDQKRVDAPRSAAAGWVGHLSPAGALISLKSGPVERRFKELLIHSWHASPNKVEMIPSGKMSKMPEDHLKLNA